MITSKACLLSDFVNILTRKDPLAGLALVQTTAPAAQLDPNAALKQELLDILRTELANKTAAPLVGDIVNIRVIESLN